MPAQPYALTERHTAVLDFLECEPDEWTIVELTGRVEVPCDWCDATGVGVTSQHCRRCVGDDCGDGWRWMVHLEVGGTLEDLRDAGLADYRLKWGEEGELCGLAWFLTPRLDPSDPLEQLWELEA